MLRCVESLHDRGILHRDIKPDNFWVKNGKIYMIDFGISKQYIIDGIHIPEAVTAS